MKLLTLLSQVFPKLLRRLDAMTPARQAGLITAGYVISGMVAVAAVTQTFIEHGGHKGPNYSALVAFAECLGTFGVVSVPATCLALYFQRRRLGAMTLVRQAGLITAGFVIAGIVAAAEVTHNFIAHGVSDGSSESGMEGFVAFLLFLGLFGIASVPATCLTLYLQRPHPPFWRRLSGTALICAVLALAGSVAVAVKGDSVVGLMGFLEALVAPVFVLGFGLCSCFSPDRASRTILRGAAFAEGASTASWLAACFIRNHHL